jgi:hypothetical protein
MDFEVRCHPPPSAAEEGRSTLTSSSRIPVHRAMLSARSAYFRAMLSTDNGGGQSLEAQQGWTWMDPTLREGTVRATLQFLYTGTLVRFTGIYLV